jgi:hypothetical protein
MEHEFSLKIKEVVKRVYGLNAGSVYSQSQLLQYINIKTKSATKGSKSRGSFANLYAIYVLVEDYIAKGYITRKDYNNYEGAVFTGLLKRQRTLPFGNKLQNHALNHRLNEEFKKYFPITENLPIIRNAETNRYWINENVIKIKINGEIVNLAPIVIEIIDLYIARKQDALKGFLDTCAKLELVSKSDSSKVESFIADLLAPNVDARLFEIVSYSILKYYYHNKHLYFGFRLTTIKKENLKLFKTGRTNANDGGIDFVMRPLGRFFQVTETLDVNKYFLDIEKVEHYPITFVVKSEKTVKELLSLLRQYAEKRYPVKQIVDKYMASIEEIITITQLKECYRQAIKQGYSSSILNEIIKQSKIEFQYEDEDEE